MRFFLSAALGSLFPFLMTTLGAAMVFFFRGRIGARAQRLCFGFAAGVMIAASFFSLLLPAVSQLSGDGVSAWLPVTVFCLLGALCLFELSGAIDRMERLEGADCQRSALLFIAITAHNIPEGMAVGLAFAAAAAGGVGLAGAWTLALGIGVQNFPEGAAISLPLRQSGMGRMRSFLLGVVSGTVEPVFGLLVLLIAGAARPVMPLLFSLAAGAMLVVSFSEMLPEAAGQRDGAWAAMAGFLLMMALDLGLG